MRRKPKIVKLIRMIIMLKTKTSLWLKKKNKAITKILIRILRKIKTKIKRLNTKNQMRM